jgi:hypothetical protein
MERDVKSPRQPSAAATPATHPAQPRDSKLSVAERYEKIAKRFPKVLAELAK